VGEFFISAKVRLNKSFAFLRTGASWNEGTYSWFVRQVFQFSRNARTAEGIQKNCRGSYE